MIVKTVRRPGQRGTRKLQREYGEKLVCVRYRVDLEQKRRLKTVEIIVDERDWIAVVDEPAVEITEPAGQVAVRIGYGELDLRRAIKSIGGIWSPTARVWYAPEQQVRKIGLQDRIVDDSL